jgi:murein DD-endopeptidase MepM/ murein hydrolase activator NlpD
MDVVRFKDRSVALGVAAMSLTIVFFAYRSAVDRRRVDALREQNRVLRQALFGLEESFDDIRAYTNSAEAVGRAGRLKKGEVLLTAEPIAVERASTSLGFLGYLSTSVLEAKRDLHHHSERSDAEEFATTLSQIDELQDQTGTIVRRLRHLATVLKYKKEFMVGIPSLKPAEGRISSDFGSRLSPFDGKRQMHYGLDIAGRLGAPVKASADGVVTFVGNFESLGKTFVVKHPSGMLTRYGHLNKYQVSEGDAVKRGDVIAQLGNSGQSTGPHLHYEVWVKNAAVDPRDFFFDMSENSNDLVSRADGIGGD